MKPYPTPTEYPFIAGRHYRLYTITHDLVEGRVKAATAQEMVLAQAKLLLSPRMTPREFTSLIIPRESIVMAWPTETHSQ